MSNSINSMHVVKRNGQLEPIDLNQILNRIKELTNGQVCGCPPLKAIDPAQIAINVCSQLTDKVTTSYLDDFAAEICAFKCADHPDYGHLASRLVISNHHKNNPLSFSQMMAHLYTNSDQDGQHVPLIAQDLHVTVMFNQQALDQAIDDMRDYQVLDYFGFKTLVRAYLLKGQRYQERYQHMLMRVALAIYLPEAQAGDLQPALNCYRVFSQALMTHATPTLFNAGTPRPQLSSCYLSGIHDSIKGMYGGLDSLSQLSKWAGGIGIWVQGIRGKDSLIRGTNGRSSGIIPYLKTVNQFACHVNQGGKRKGSVAVYLQPWHPDIIEFLNLKKNHGSEELRARDLFYALWVSDLFMKRVQQALSGQTDVTWSLFCPDRCRKLLDVYGQEFEQLYLQYEQEGKYVRQVNIMEIWQAILDSQKETGVPYILYKDAVNHLNNQSHIGTIKSSNLCAEIQLYSDHQETAVCNLASINLRAMVKDNQFDFQLLAQTVRQAVSNLDRVIDLNWYPIKQARRANFRHRPMGIGVQGLADVFFLLKIPYDSPQARRLNHDIFETIYYQALYQSHQLACQLRDKLSRLTSDKLDTIRDLSAQCDQLHNLIEAIDCSETQDNHLMPYQKQAVDQMRLQFQEKKARLIKLLTKARLPIYGWQQWQYLPFTADSYVGAYPTFQGSQLQQGKFHFENYRNYQKSRQQNMPVHQPSGRWDWEALRAKIQADGVRNSMLVALMPTASTAQILGNVEAFEPQTSNLYARRVLSGTFMVVNKYLQQDLLQLGLWDTHMKERIMLDNGSVQKIDSIPDNLKAVYKTAWELSKKAMIEMSADRGQYVDHSQSFNMFISDPTDSLLSSVLLYGWKLGLKTGMYYLRRQTLVRPQQFSIDMTKHQEQMTVPRADSPVCTMCSG